MKNLPIHTNSMPAISFIGFDKNIEFRPDLPITPITKLDIANVTTQSYNRYDSNVKTRAWENSLAGKLPVFILFFYTQLKNTNFIKDFLLPTNPEEEEDAIKANYYDHLVAQYAKTTKNASVIL
jgi:hypothetical protein